MTSCPDLREILLSGARRLTEAGVEGAARDARLLLAHACSVEPLDIILRETERADPALRERFEGLIARRAAGEPVSRIRGWREFYGRRFILSPDVLDPRPETELLVAEGVRRLPPDGRVLDLGTGSGCILLSVLGERGDASGAGVDISSGAIVVARANALALGAGGRAVFHEASFADARPGMFDLVLSNPPYIPRSDVTELAREVREHDPALALSPGEDGLAAYRDILASMNCWLRPGGSLGLEVGVGQAGEVGRLMARAGLEDISALDDLAGIPRALFARRPADHPMTAAHTEEILS